ncbi:MAG: UDP-N-acetylglucosamine--N-acetylmuramyl-(pentapeptide) pyrophosphoryl-undecaprenol N-acetylglucosamine transferase [Microbacteriaceae bacterium]|nr:UDP-N-acetylglucosamine--N-acetylmuramyl-(pentapeptide) pyrophosphoryl-undecaprenol N-acetylglucosamine transferase [Microbacteriaceae bacterium]
MTRYLMAGGGTAGHVNPLLATADRLRFEDSAAEILVLGTNEGLEARLVPARGYRLLTVARLPFPRRFGVAALRFPGQFVALIRSVRHILSEHQIDVVVGFGGYVAAPAYLAARLMRIPIVVHEANARAGMANRFGSLLTPFVGVAFSRTALRRARVVGMPLRAEIVSLDRATERADARREFGLDPHRQTLLVTGGSLGSDRLNRTLIATITLVLGAGWQVLHICGTRSELDYPSLAGYVVVPYSDQMHRALASADLVVARAGASTVSEVTALALPAIYVPLSVGNGEQRLNAADAVAAGAARLVNDADFSADWIADHLLPLLMSPADIAALAAAASSLAARDGAERLVTVIHEAVSRPVGLPR